LYPHIVLKDGVFMNLKSKDLLGLRELSVEEIQFILDTARTMKLVLTSKNKKTPHLQG
jgi:aspartate carbamoyltransferase catalytic subunit